MTAFNWKSAEERQLKFLKAVKRHASEMGAQDQVKHLAKRIEHIEQDMKNDG